MPTFTPISKTQVRTHVLSLLNATDNYAGTSDDPSHPDAEIDESTLQYDGEVIESILTARPRHPYRSDLLTWTADLDSGAAVPPHLGRADRVEIKLTSLSSLYVKGVRVSQDNLQMLFDNTGGIYGSTTETLGHYTLVEEEGEGGDLLLFLGYKARLLLGNYTRTTNCQAPQFAYPTVVALVLAQLFMKEGRDPAAAGHYARLGYSGLMRIRSGSMEVPPLTAPGQ